MRARIPTHAPQLIDVVSGRSPGHASLAEAKVKPRLALRRPLVVGGDGLERGRDVRRDQRHRPLRVRPKRHPRPDLAEAWRRLVQRCCDALLEERERQCYAGDAAAYYGDVEWLGWWAAELGWWSHGGDLRDLDAVEELVVLESERAVGGLLCTEYRCHHTAIRGVSNSELERLEDHSVDPIIGMVPSRPEGASEAEVLREKA